MTSAVYPGSFDPVTLGHLNIIERAARIFDRLSICVLVNGSKSPMFTPDERVAMLKEVTAHLPNVSVFSSDRLLADFAKEHGCSVIVKGLRAISDFDRELQMAHFNRKLNPQLDTMFLTAEHQFMYLSSSAVKELGRFRADLSEVLPPAIIPKFENRMKESLGG